MEKIKKLTNKQKAEFKKKLKALLKEYNVNIQFVCSPCSDTYGIYDAGIAVCENKTDNQVLRTDYWYLDENNI